MEVRGARGLTAAPQASSPIQAAAPGPVDGKIIQIRYILPTIGDILGNPNQAAIESAIKNRLIDTYADGSFRPNQTVSREDLARSLVFNTSLASNSRRDSEIYGCFRRFAEFCRSDYRERFDSARL